MSKTEDNAFADTVVEHAVPAVQPLRASWFTRAIYCVSLLGLIASSFGQASSWVGLATGGGLIGSLGPAVFLLVGAAIVYRVYRVIRYPAALDARPPYLLGWIVRALGWLLMFAGSLGIAAMFGVKPLTLLIFKSAGENGIGFFVVGLYATMIAGAGWIGCVVFEISRAIGRRVTPPSPRRTRSQFVQDSVVLASLAAVAIVLPFALKTVFGAPCYGPNITACAAKVEGRVARLATAAVGAPVGLQSNIDEVEFRHTGGSKQWVLKESPRFSLESSGHPVAPDNAADVQVIINAVPAGRGVTVNLTVSEKGQQTAQFTTRYASRARLDPVDGKRKLVVDLERNVVPPHMTRGDKDRGFRVDALYGQMRRAIGSGREVAEEAARVKVSAVMTGQSELPAAQSAGDAHPSKNCAGLLKIGSTNAEKEDGRWGHYRHQISFLGGAEPAPVALVRPGDRISCREGVVWAADVLRPERVVHIRRYDATGNLQRNLMVGMPPGGKDDAEFVDENSIVEKDGQLAFSVFVYGITSRKRQVEHFTVKL
jgi:hypothetical protein